MHNDFAKYLLDRKLVAHDVAERIRDTSENARVPVGRLLLEAGVLTMREVMQVLSLQGEAPGLRFGEIAMREGLIDTAQLEAALRRQATARRHQIEVVCQMSLFCDAELRGLMMDYIAFLELRAAEEQGEQAA